MLIYFVQDILCDPVCFPAKVIPGFLFTAYCSQAGANGAVIIVIVFFLFRFWLKNSIGAFRNTNAYIYTQQSAHTMRRHAVLKIDYLRDISRDKAVKRSAILFESIRLDVRIYSRLNFVDDLSCIDFCSLLQKIKHIGALLLLAK